MKSNRWLAAALCTLGALAHAQDLPKSLSGRWTWAEKGASQTFSLDNIQRQGDNAFSASLTWWTMNPKCAIRNAPIVGRITEAGLAFDATTKCDVSFTAELSRAEKGWQGKGLTKNDSSVVVDIKAE